MNSKKIVFVLLFWAIKIFPDLPAMAVIELGGDISKSESKILSDKLSSILISTGRFKLVERSMMEEILKEQGFQQTGCTDQNCAVEIGQLLGVQKMCTGSVGKIGSSYSITLRIVNVATGEIETNVTFDFKGDIEDVLYEGLAEAVNKLLGTLNVSDNNSVKTKKISSYEDRLKRKKIFAIVSTVLTTGTAGASIYSWIDKKNIHDDYLSVSDQNLQDKYIINEERAYKRALVFTSITGALLPTTIVLWAKKIKNKDAEKISITPIIIPGEASVHLTCKF